MDFKKARLCLYILVLTSAFSALGDNSSEIKLMLENINATFSEYYAPKEWKEKHHGWNLEQEIADLSAATQKSTKVADFHNGLKQFFLKTRDYHTSIFFADTSTSKLPMAIKYIDNNFYLAYLDTSLPANFGLMLGDKITHINDQEVKDLAWSLIGRVENPSKTDWALAARKLTTRVGIMHDRVEKGSVVIRAERENKAYQAQVVWNYNANNMSLKNIKSSHINNSRLNLDINNEAQESFNFISSHIQERVHKVSFADYMKKAAQEKASNPSAFAAKESFLPRLGAKVVWSADAKSKWQAYIYLNESNKLVGFIRLPTFSPEEEDYSERAKEFGEIINKMEEIADILVIDQQNNPGGSIFYLYALASMLTDKPLMNPRHRFNIDSKEVWQAHQMLKGIDTIINALPTGEAVGDMHGYPLNAQFFLHMKSYLQFIIDQWNAGKKLSDPYFLYGVDYIQPHPEYKFTKKIIILINELDFSGGDFFPAIFQDNKRAILVGTNTAGAGGFVLSNSERNRVGVMQYSYTGSHALRIDGTPLEDLGVAPDLVLEISPEDLKTKFAHYKFALNSLLKVLLE